MTIVRRLILTLFIALIALVFVGGYGLLQLHHSYERVDGLETRTVPGLKTISMALDDVGTMRLTVYRYVVDGIDSASQAAMQKALDDADKSFDAHIADYAQNDIADDTDRTLLEGARATRTARWRYCMTRVWCITRRWRSTTACTRISTTPSSMPTPCARKMPPRISWRSGC